MKKLIILFFIVAVLCSHPVSSQAISEISEEDKNKFLPIINEVIQPVFKVHQKRIKTLAFLEVCNDSEKAKKLFDQKIIEQDIYEMVQDAATRFSLSNDEITPSVMMIVTYIEGFRKGYGVAVQATISNDEELKKLCDYAQKESARELKKNK